MKLTPWYLVALAPMALAGWSGVFFGQCAVLAVTLCIFVGTLSLGHDRAIISPASAMSTEVFRNTLPSIQVSEHGATHGTEASRASPRSG